MINKSVSKEKSTLNIETELLSHLSSAPYSDEFLESLRDYCVNRLQARQDAKLSKILLVPNADNTQMVNYHSLKVKQIKI